MGVPLRRPGALGGDSSSWSGQPSPGPPRPLARELHSPRVPASLPSPGLPGLPLAGSPLQCAPSSGHCRGSSCPTSPPFLPGFQGLEHGFSFLVASSSTVSQDLTLPTLPLF